MPYTRPKLDVKEPMLCRPTLMQMSATELSVVRSSAAARFHPPGEQIRVRRLTERAPELAAEMRLRQAGSAGQFRDVDILEEAGVGEILRAQQVPGRRD